MWSGRVGGWSRRVTVPLEAATWGTWSAGSRRSTRRHHLKYQKLIISKQIIYLRQKYLTAKIDIRLLTKSTAAQNEVAHSYDRLRGLYFMAVVFAAPIFYDSCFCGSYILWQLFLRQI